MSFKSFDSIFLKVMDFFLSIIKVSYIIPRTDSAVNENEFWQNRFLLIEDRNCYALFKYAKIGTKRKKEKS